MLKKVSILTLCICLLISTTPFNSYAEEAQIDNPDSIEATEIGNDTSADAVANAKTVADVIAQSKFSGITGYGFAAEEGNNFIDQIKGKNTTVVGNNNIKNGPDRQIINRDGSVLYIQDKYYSTASGTIGACFDADTGVFRYMNADGTPMQIEVPKDQYEQAVSLMEKKIREGKIPNVDDPAEAKNLVRKGNLTFQQAKNLAKAGTIESLTYDAAHGVITAGTTFGISTLLNYAIRRINGEERGDAIKESAIPGVKTGVGAFCTSVIAGQLSKTGIMNWMKPSTEALTKALGEDFSKALLKAYGQKVLAAEGETVAQSATKQAAELLRSQALVAAVTITVFSVPDAIDMFRGRISKKQFVKNFAVTAVSVVAGTAGYGVGATLGNLLVPGIGTIPGGIVGSILIGTGGMLLTDLIADYITDDDADEMYEITQNTFAEYCTDYLVNEEEAQAISEEFSTMLTKDMYKDMYQSEDREAFIKQKMEPLFEAQVKKRAVIDVPTEEEYRASLKESLAGVVFIH